MIVGASDFQLPAIIKAKEMGLYVGVVDYNPNAVGVPFANEYFNVSTIDKDGLLIAVEQFKADGIITLCTDMPVRAIAFVCDQLGLLGMKLHAAVVATDKGVMIKEFEKHNVEHPVFQILHQGDIKEFARDKFTYPIITKPIDNSGSRGIYLVHSYDELKGALDYSSEEGRSGDVIVEEYMSGPEVSVELMVLNGIPYVLQVTDKLTTGAPHFVEIGHSQPSRLPKDDLEKISDLAKRAAMAVGIENGAGHAEIILTESGPKVVEIGARMGGGCITTHLVPYSTGIDMTRATIEVALGDTPDIDRKFDKASAIRFIAPKVGKVVSISGESDAKSVPGIKDVEIQCKIGQRIRNFENGTDRIGYVISQANSPEEAIRICEEALKKICIEVK